ncbi:MAG: hypothetical protein RLZZ543_212 [Bacteroidota bacterium]|jgi:carboxymethylenebutenolidase
MKHTLTLAFALLIAGFTQAQKSCCTKPTNDGSAEAMAMNVEFQRAHELPAPLNFSSEAGKMITFKNTDGTPGNAYFVPATTPSNKVLVMCHEWWGLNDYIKREAVEWAKELGVSVYAIDLYDGKVGTTQEEAGALMGGLDQKHASAIVGGLLSYIGTGKEIATLGWCMGGSWSFQTALQAGNDCKACVMYYGFPEQDVTKLKALKTDVLFILANQDGFIQRPAIETFAAAVKKESGHAVSIEAFDGAHAFANPSNPKFNAEASAKAKVLALAAIRKGLKL